jgi:integrase
MFKWAVSVELVPPSVYQTLAAVADLRKDHTSAREKPPVRPAPDADVNAVMAAVSPTVRVMIEVQLACGGRPQDVVEMRAGDIDRTGPVWEYRPGRHKGEHRDRERLLFLGPKAQVAIGPLLEGLGETDHVFSPRRAEATRLAALRAPHRNCSTCARSTMPQVIAAPSGARARQ